MRSYGHYCAVARALGVVGDRWALLVVRELLLRGSCRYKDLQDGLPGISTNLLADRLRELVGAGVVQRVDPSPPIATALYELTDRGAALAPVLHALGTWGAELMEAPRGTDAFLGHWLAFPLSRLTDSAPDRPPVAIEIRTSGGPVVVQTVDGDVHATPGRARVADAIIDGPPDLAIAMLRGALSIAEAEALGLRIDGDPAAVERLRPTER